MKVGDRLVRWLAGTIPMDVVVIAETETTFDCGTPDALPGVVWTFDKATGAEIDEELGFGPPPLMTSSYVAMPGVTYKVQG